MIKKKESKATEKDFLNSLNGIDICKMASAHTKYIMFLQLKEKVLNGKMKCKNNIKNIGNLCILYGLNTLMQENSGCFESGYF